MKQMNRFIEITKKEYNVTQVHQYYFDEEELANLLDEIIHNCSYVVHGSFKVPYDAKVDFHKQEIIEGATLPNNEPLFINIESLYPFSSHSGLIHYENDSIGVIGTKVCVPQLAYIINEILRNNPEGIIRLEDYSRSDELIDIDDKIVIIGDDIDKLRELRDKKCKGQYFDSKLLKEFYQRLCELIKVGLISEKEEFEDKYSKMMELDHVSSYEVEGNEKRFYRYYYDREAIISLKEIIKKRFPSSQLVRIIDRILNDDEEGIRELEFYPQRDEYAMDIFRRNYDAIKAFIYPKICIRCERIFTPSGEQAKLYTLSF